MWRSRKLVAAAMAVAAVMLVTTVRSLSAQAGAAEEQAVLKAESARFNAMIKGDTAALEKLLADELTYTHSNASVQGKAEFISDIKTGKIKYLTVEASEQKARIFGTTAVATGLAAVHVVQNGNDLTFKIRYTDTHLRRGGAWQMVAWQSTRLPS